MTKRTLDEFEISALDINDAKLVHFEMDLVRRQIILEVSGGRLQFGRPKEPGTFVLTLSQWDRIDISLYSEHEKRWQTPVEPRPDDKLKSLGEVRWDPKQVLLHGEDLKTGQWVCYRLMNVKIKVTLEIQGE